jgi:hypothetical protein
MKKTMMQCMPAFVIHFFAEAYIVSNFCNFSIKEEFSIYNQMKARKIFIVLILTYTCFFKSAAQTDLPPKRYLVEGSAMTGWLFAGKASAAKIINAPVYNLSVGYIRNEVAMYELNINTLFSQTRFPNWNNTSDTTTTYSQTYIMLGIVRTFNTEIPKFSPYVSTMIGILSQRIHAPDVSPQTQIAAGLSGGIKYFIKENLGIKLQARIQAPLSGIGLGVGIGFGGPSVGVGSYSNNIQFDLSGGACFRF